MNAPYNTGTLKLREAATHFQRAGLWVLVIENRGCGAITTLAAAERFADLEEAHRLALLEQHNEVDLLSPIGEGATLPRREDLADDPPDTHPQL